MRCLSRFLFIALMLVLLPLRGWAGNVMAVDMYATSALQAKTAETVKTASTASQTPMPPDCAMHSQAQPDNADGAAPHCSSCDTCELCLAVAKPTPAHWSANRLARQPSLLAFNASFSSATSAASLKPPIA